MVDFWEDFEAVRPAAGTAKPFLRPARLKEIVVRNAPTREMPIRKSLSTKMALLSQSCPFTGCMGYHYSTKPRFGDVSVGCGSGSNRSETTNLEGDWG